MKRFGLPTYPITDGMVLGKRIPDELEWLLDHGCIQSDLYQYKKITKVDGSYELRQNKDARSQEETRMASASTLQELLKAHKINIAYWYWYPQY